MKYQKTTSCSRRRRICPVVSFVLVLLAFAAASASAADIADFSIEWLDTSRFPVNVVYYSTTDQNGEPTEQMWASEHVRVVERRPEGTAGNQSVEHKAHGFEDGSHAPAYLSIIIDSSGSMEGSLEPVLGAAHNLIDQLDHQDRAEIIDFDSTVVTRRSFTDNKDEMRSALDQVTVGGGTALYDAVATGLDHLARKTGMKTIVVLSDGEDENSTIYTYERLTERLGREGVRVFTIALGTSVDTDTLSSLADRSGGSFYRTAEAADVSEIYGGIIRYLHSLHRFWYTSALGMFDGSNRSITVRHRPSGTERDAEYTAPSGRFWSHALFYRPGSWTQVRISPNGDYVMFPAYRALVTAEGRRLTNYRWQETYDGQMTEHFYCGFTHRAYGQLYRYDPDKPQVEFIESNTLLENASGDYHRDWHWWAKAISPNERYLLMVSDPSDDFPYDYYFLLFDRIEERVLWEQGLYQGEFDEPGPISVADNGRAAVVQDANLYMVASDGEVLYSMMWSETGRRWEALDMSADGNVFLGRDYGRDEVAAYRGDGTLLWVRSSESSDTAGYVSVSPNGQYLAYADLEGPHILTQDETVLFELPTEVDPITKGYLGYQASIDVADNGRFVYSLGSRAYYRQLSD